MTRIEEIKNAIVQYAKAYNRLEDLQLREEKLEDRMLPLGDQKTGVIGEFYALLYLMHKYPTSEVKIAKGSVDIEVKKRKGESLKIQVKTVGPRSRTKQLSPIKAGYNELHLVQLNKQFLPYKYWIIRDQVEGAGKKPGSFTDREEVEIGGWL